jgi:phosphatidylserine decarboxylase
LTIPGGKIIILDVSMGSSNTQERRIHNRIGIAREGFPFVGIGLVLTLLFLFLEVASLAIVAGALTLFVLYFFRDPDRESEAQERAVLTPADGKVLGAWTLESGENPLGTRAVKVSVFMSLFDVHVNRIPTGGRISRISYRPGAFFAANLDKASDKNEQNAVTLDTHDGKQIVFVQIAGLIARRIACWVREGDEVRAGQRFGLIRFGSRVDVFLPEGSRVEVLPRQKVKAGKTIIGYLP